MKPVFIQRVSSIHPDLPGLSAGLGGNRLACVEPDYKEIITNAGLRRRMSRVVRMGVSAGLMCLADSVQPDAIITATALGCLADTEKFLDSVVHNEPSLMNPTPFIQSTFNTIGGQLALITGNYGANITYVHRGFSFESALLESMLMLAEGEAHTVLTGSVDELTDFSFEIMRRLGFWKAQKDWASGLFPASSRGSIAGEGAHFFVLSAASSEQDYAVLKGVSCCYKPLDREVITLLDALLEQHGLSYVDIDLIVTGDNGDVRFDCRYDALCRSCFSNTPRARFKHLCGEYATASSFALWLSSRALKNQELPVQTVCSAGSLVASIRYVVIYNHFMDGNHSLILLSKI